MKLILTGATGTVGNSVLVHALKDSRVGQVLALTRRSLPLEHPKLVVNVRDSFLDYSDLGPQFAQYDVCIWALGTSQTQVNAEEYSIITHDYAIAAAKQMIWANPSLVFIFVSGAGADPSEKSKILFSRLKGKTENSLQALALHNVYIVRPGGIEPSHRKNGLAFANRLLLPLFPVLRLLVPNKVITSDDLARAMLRVGHEGYEKRIVDNTTLKKLASFT